VPAYRHNSEYRFIFHRTAGIAARAAFHPKTAVKKAFPVATPSPYLPHTYTHTVVSHYVSTRENKNGEMGKNSPSSTPPRKKFSFLNILFAFGFFWG
jgi:hypothetical protein